mmetsp:Transcript_9120/g.15788  ORF Transcript_9120/g.15788 Transcript_9120/m.15788 type:complete len:94 (+) Transcript_9120:31-312(+)
MHLLRCTCMTPRCFYTLTSARTATDQIPVSAFSVLSAEFSASRPVSNVGAASFSGSATDSKLSCKEQSLASDLHAMRLATLNKIPKATMHIPM